MLAILSTLLVFCITLLFVYNWQKHSYWKSKNVPTSSVLPLLGNMRELTVGYRWENLDKMYKTHKSKGFWGVYSFFSPELVICNPELLRDVMVKDADHFVDRRTIKLPGDDSLFNEMLTATEGEHWKSLRSVMSPTFTSGKIKSMFPLIASKTEDLIEECEKQMKLESYVDMNILFRYYTMDVIATCAFGIDANCLQNKEASMFIKSGAYFTSIDLGRFLKFMLLMIAPRIYNALGITVSSEYLSFLKNAIKDTVETRKKLNTRRGDFLDLMLDALEEIKASKDESKYPMTMTTVTAESVLFLLAGFDTTSNALIFMIYLLAKNRDKQDILRKELQKIVESDGELTYQNVMEAQYLDCCLAETLRGYTPAHFTERKCTKSYKFSESGLEIPTKMMVGIPIWSIHHDEEYWEDPFSFRPERFFPENKANIKPYTYLPFGLGPRNCIAMRFAQLETKLTMAKIILKFDINLRPGFTELKLMKTLNTLRPDDNGVQLVFKTISSK